MDSLLVEPVFPPHPVVHVLRPASDEFALDPGPWENPKIALEKWAPEAGEKRDQWLEYAASSGFDESDPPSPPGVHITTETKFSNEALRNVMRGLRDKVQTIYREHIQPVQFEFTIQYDE